VHPNVGIEVAYRRRLDALIEDMHRSLTYWLRAAYRANPPEVAELAADVSPATAIRAMLSRLTRRWRQRFATAADELARWFATAAAERSDAALQSILRRGGFSVRFKLTRAANDILQATIAQNVALIKSIGQQHLSQVEGIVMRSVVSGRDVGTLTKELEDQFGVTRRRAAFISLDQNNKATAAITRCRQIELGLDRAQWVHSRAGKEPRPTHVKASRDKIIYNVAEGWLDPALNKRIWPGTEPRCRCVSRAVIAGFS
jgi:uncharacterized protein with gpF-like domain